MVWLPTVRLEVLKLALVTPPEVLRLPCPRLVAPSEKITSPVGVPAALPVTVVVKVSACPNTAGLGAEASCVAAAGLVTGWGRVPTVPGRFVCPAEGAVAG